MLEKPGAPVFPDFVPGITTPVHGNIDARRQNLDKSQCAPKVKESIRGGPESIGHHSAGQDNSLIDFGGGQVLGSLHHFIRPVRDEDLIVLAPGTIVNNDSPIRLRHLQAVHHHQGLDKNIQRTSPALKHLFQMGILKIEFAGDKIVFLVEGAACNKYLDHETKGRK